MALNGNALLPRHPIPLVSEFSDGFVPPTTPSTISSQNSCTISTSLFAKDYAESVSGDRYTLPFRSASNKLFRANYNHYAEYGNKSSYCEVRELPMFEQASIEDNGFGPPSCINQPQDMKATSPSHERYPKLIARVERPDTASLSICAKNVSPVDFGSLLPRNLSETRDTSCAEISKEPTMRYSHLQNSFTSPEHKSVFLNNNSGPGPVSNASGSSASSSIPVYGNFIVKVQVEGDALVESIFSGPKSSSRSQSENTTDNAEIHSTTSGQLIDASLLTNPREIYSENARCDIEDWLFTHSTASGFELKGEQSCHALLSDNTYPSLASSQYRSARGDLWDSAVYILTPYLLCPAELTEDEFVSLACTEGNGTATWLEINAPDVVHRAINRWISATATLRRAGISPNCVSAEFMASFEWMSDKEKQSTILQYQEFELQALFIFKRWALKDSFLTAFKQLPVSDGATMLRRLQSTTLIHSQPLTQIFEHSQENSFASKARNEGSIAVNDISANLNDFNDVTLDQRIDSMRRQSSHKKSSELERPKEGLHHAENISLRETDDFIQRNSNKDISSTPTDSCSSDENSIAAILSSIKSTATTIQQKLDRYTCASYDSGAYIQKLSSQHLTFSEYSKAVENAPTFTSYDKNHVMEYFMNNPEFIKSSESSGSVNQTRSENGYVNNDCVIRISSTASTASVDSSLESLSKYPSINIQHTDDCLNFHFPKSSDRKNIFATLRKRFSPLNVTGHRTTIPNHDTRQRKPNTLRNTMSVAWGIIKGSRNSRGDVKDIQY